MIDVIDSRFSSQLQISAARPVPLTADCRREAENARDACDKIMFGTNFSHKKGGVSLKFLIDVSVNVTQ